MCAVVRRIDSPGQQGERVVDDAPYREGYGAYWRRVRMAENPYEPGSEGFVLWDRGWIQGQLEQCDE
jgi:hypothetical protein